MQDIALGTIFNAKYRFIDLINSGSFAAVYLARNIRTGEDVAVKCVPKTRSDDGTILPDQEFDIELDCHKALGRHPNIVSIIDTFETESMQFLVLEYCPNGDLYDAIHKNSELVATSPRVRDLFLQLVDAVLYMHSKGWYHRDIKLENIFIGSNGRIKLGDFGLATYDKWSHDPAVGSDPYMAPEQYDCGDYGYAPSKADVWSICICLLHALFKKNPFQIPSLKDCSFQEFCKNSCTLRYSYPNITDGAFEAIKQGLTTRPEERDLITLRQKIRDTQRFIDDNSARNYIQWTKHLSTVDESSVSDQYGSSLGTMSFETSFGSASPGSGGSRSLSNMFPDYENTGSWEDLFDQDMKDMEEQQRQREQRRDSFTGISPLSNCEPSTVNSRANGFVSNEATGRAVPIPGCRRNRRAAFVCENDPFSLTPFSPISFASKPDVAKSPSKRDVDKWTFLGMRRKNHGYNMSNKNCYSTPQQQQETIFPMSPPSSFNESPLSRKLLLDQDWRKNAMTGRSNPSNSPPPCIPSQSHNRKRSKHAQNRKTGKKSALLCSNWRLPRGCTGPTTAITTGYAFRPNW